MFNNQLSGGKRKSKTYQKTPTPVITDFCRINTPTKAKLPVCSLPECGCGKKRYAKLALPVDRRPLHHRSSLDSFPLTRCHLFKSPSALQLSSVLCLMLSSFSPKAHYILTSPLAFSFSICLFIKKKISISGNNHFTWLCLIVPHSRNIQHIF